jgi:hypothetical protein
MIKRLVSPTRSKRALLGAGALACFAAAIVLAPSDVRSQLYTGRHDAVADVTASPQLPVSAVAPRGDAFAPRAEIDDDRPAGVSAPSPIALPHLPGSPTSQQATVATTRVTAIATGALPTAIVESGGSSHLVTVGDVLDGSEIAAIDRGSITLASGRHLQLEPAAPAP